MNVFVIHGSPRSQGNSSYLAEVLAENLGASELERTRLVELAYSGCAGCMSCRKRSEECVLRDDLAPVLQRIKEADVLVLAAPVYQEYINGTTKCLVDRFFSYLSKEHFQRLAAGETDIPTRLGPDKTIAVVLAQGQPEGMYPYLEGTLTAVMREAGFRHVHIVRCCDLNGPKDSRDREDLHGRLAALGEEIRARHA